MEGPTVRVSCNFWLFFFSFFSTSLCWLGSHILAVFSFYNFVFNGIFVIKHTWRDPLSRLATTFDHFFIFLLHWSLLAGFFLSFFFCFSSSSFTTLRWLFFLFFFCSSSPLIFDFQFFFFFLFLSLGLGLLVFFSFFLHWVLVSGFLFFFI